jgi:cell division septal protein FtsQ
VGAFGLVALAVGVWGITRSPLLNLDHVRIVGVNGAQAGEVRQAVELETGTAMFELDLGAAEEALNSRPWIRRALVERDWPGTVVITVEARVAVAQTGLGDERTMVDADGVAFTTASRPDPALLWIAIESTTELGAIDPVALAGLPVALALTEDLLPWIESVVVLPEADSAGRPLLEIELIGGAVVELGTGELIDDQVQALRSILNSTELACLSELDLVVPDLNTFLRDFECEGIADAPVE